MSESKNVIAELKKIADEANPWKDNPPLRCDIPYLLLLSAIKLLKAQEPVEKHIKTSRSGTSWWYSCGNCNRAIDPNDKYCRHCGRAVKWE